MSHFYYEGNVIIKNVFFWLGVPWLQDLDTITCMRPKWVLVAPQTTTEQTKTFEFAFDIFHAFLPKNPRLEKYISTG